LDVIGQRPTIMTLSELLIKIRMIILRGSKFMAGKELYGKLEISAILIVLVSGRSTKLRFGLQGLLKWTRVNDAAVRQMNADVLMWIEFYVADMLRVGSTSLTSITYLKFSF
jgi:hypothetical protein